MNLLRRTLALLFALLSLAPEVCSAFEPVWEFRMGTDSTPSNALFGGIERRESCGIVRWDASHLFVYSLVSTGGLAVRGPNGGASGEWAFLAQIVVSDTGQVIRTERLPAESFTSKLILAAEDIVISNPGNLAFYSRSFQPLQDRYQYSPMDRRQNKPAVVGNKQSAGYIYASPDQQHFILLDMFGRQHANAHIFNGTSLQLEATIPIAEVQPESLSPGNDGFYFTNAGNNDRVFFCSYGGNVIEWLRQPTKGLYVPHNPVYLGSDRWLDVFQQVSIIDSSRIEKLYNVNLKSERLGRPAVISPGKAHSAVYEWHVRPNGVFNRDLTTVDTAILIVQLDSPYSICRIPTHSDSTTQLALYFASESKLIIMHDLDVSAYNVSSCMLGAP